MRGSELINTLTVEYHTTTTSDNVNLCIKRYKPKTTKTEPIPVVLCHGLVANKHSLDFGDINDSDWHNYSLASYLLTENKEKNVTFDVWVPELRGIRSFHQQSNCTKTWKPEKYNWCVDDYIEKDVPAIINKIQKTYEKKIPIFWIGMSMGGMIAYGYGETEHGFQNLKGVVTIGSPVAFTYNQKAWSHLLKVIPPGHASIRFNPKELLQGKDEIIRLMKEHGSNPDNLENGIFKKYVTLGFDNYLSLKVMKQFSLFFRYKDFCKYPRFPWITSIARQIPLVNKAIQPESYTKRLHRFKTPLLAIAGKNDQQAPPKEVKYAVGHVGSYNVTYYECSKGNNGLSFDYGHLDFHLGKQVKKDVYSIILKWLIKHNDK